MKIFFSRYLSRFFYLSLWVNVFLYFVLVSLLLTIFFVLATYNFLIFVVYEFLNLSVSHLLPDNSSFLQSFPKKSELLKLLTEENVLSKFFGRVSLALPLVWLASHVNGVINKRKKLYAEYEHKRIVMEFYVAFKDQIEDNSILKEAFAKSVTDVILRFPSIIGKAQESDSPIDKILSTFKKEKDTKEDD